MCARAYVHACVCVCDLSKTHLKGEYDVLANKLILHHASILLSSLCTTYRAAPQAPDWLNLT